MNKCLIILASIVLIIAIVSVIEPNINKNDIVQYSKIPSLLKISENDLKSNDYVSIMTYNIRFQFLDKNKNKWENRKEKIIQNIKKYNPDIFAIQEDTKDQIEYVEDSLLPEYNYIGLMIDADENSHHNTIWVRRKKFRPLWRKNVHLNEKGKPFEKGWDAKELRTATICLLEHIPYPREKIVIVNAHLDHMGRIARQESMKLIFKEIALEFHGQGLPVFLMGDFNESPKQAVDNYVIEQNYIDSYEECKNNSISNQCYFGDFHPSSFHYFLGKLVDNIFIRSIFYSVYSIYNKKLSDFNRFHLDHMYYKQGNELKVKTLYFSMPSDDVYNSKDGIYSSDHYPLFTLFKLTKQENKDKKKEE